MRGKAGRLGAGSIKMIRGLVREPQLAVDLPRWIRDAPVRKDPLKFRRPWWNYAAVGFVERRLPEGAHVFEYGGGSSTLWLLDHGANVITVEDDDLWFRNLQRLVPDADLRFVPRTADSTPTAHGSFAAYSHAIDAEPDQSFDLVVVDGQARRDCMLAAAPKVKPGGMLLLDDSQWSDTAPPGRERHRLRAPYADLPEHLRGWSVRHLRGLKPGTWLAVQTSIWIRPLRS